MSLRVSVFRRKLPLVKLFTSSMSAVELLQLTRKGESLLIHLFSPIKLKKKDVTGEDEDDIDHIPFVTLES